jgi:hypothetical protein
MSSEKEKTVKKIENKLPKEVADKYSLKSIRPGKYSFAKYGEIDLRIISLEKADKLVKDGFPHLVAKKAPAKPDTSNADEILASAEEVKNTAVKLLDEAKKEKKDSEKLMVAAVKEKEAAEKLMAEAKKGKDTPDKE